MPEIARPGRACDCCTAQNPLSFFDLSAGDFAGDPPSRLGSFPDRNFG
jgi:hypothetical protein